jgi:uncharacterized membrane protein YbhN (UPF0104 family)
MKTKKFLFKSAQVLIIVLIFYFLIKSLVSNWSQVKDFNWEFDYYFLTIAFVLQILTLLWLIQIFKWILTKSGSSISYLRLFKVWFISGLGKYLPGKVWQVLGMIFMLEKEGVSKKHAFSSVVLGQTLSVISGLFVSVLLLGADLYSKFFSRKPGFMVAEVIATLILLVLLCYPKVLEKIVNLGLGILKKEKISLDITVKDVIIYFLSYTLSWLFYGLAFLIFIKAIAQASFNIYPTLTGSFAFSLNMGFLALFAPGGIGVREGILVLLLETYFPAPVAVLISILSRLWISLVELLCFLIALLLK